MNAGPIDILPAAVVIVALFVFAALARVALHFFLRVHVAEKIGGDHNAALGYEYAGYFLGVLLVAGSVLDGIAGSDTSAGVAGGSGAAEVWTYALQAGLYGIFGILVLALFARLGFRLLLKTNIVAGVRANNPSAGIVAAGGHIAVALVVAGALSGDTQGGDFSVAVLFLALGLIALWAITYLYRFIIRYDDSREITNGNVAAALSYAGMMVAIGMIVGHALNGNFTDYATSLALSGRALLFVLILYPVRQFIVQGVLLGDGFTLYGGRLDREISHDQNTGAGAVEAAAYIAAALVALQVGS
ncbi:MAG TPA: DUF350 domain-containing protein [Bacteroidota bacterium]|nr:DUF350 domain-containing protein [Bacteroidota bacterium]